ncbi:hypothetical protein C3747_42g335 [Trypanosoma cruzi]|uniref:Target of rapamycin (TOR) kinase 1 n=1 Tax=Trypanosoma cruzi TaxID=5693 RepID=A0A2V2WYA0_TRYCR|nr:hypothetical protein C3747_42g335 [Trypanosoma cruzi]RNC45785.1 rab1 small GTP-binding protein [Trypanosoma cruzi]
MIFIIILTKPQDAPRKRSAPPQEERAIPLQQPNVPVLKLGRNRSRLNPATLERLMQVWGLVGRLAFPLSSSGKARGSSRRIPATGARLAEAGMVEDASSTITSGGCIIPFSVVEEKIAASRLRWIAWPRDKNRDDPCEANAPLSHIFHCLPPVVAEAASRLDLKVFSSRVSLPRGTRHLFRCRVEDGALVGPARLPMGHNAGPETLQIIISSAFAGRRRWFAFSGPHPHCCVFAFLPTTHALAGSKGGATLWEAQVLRNADSCHASLGEERESGATH